ncbi:hypothetical protein PUR49_05335 [Streptomyces sp. BE147]|uniref:hypothetical protein n=1 Tax=Streptomyces sp. BE147 TaxID=3002524 RepID=UPI002E797C12|nr:hypothetical protein [Streptomyces sp. BE147]MEE1735938.1 hypothetical protein [Streptomyces sp. BE147]
MFVSRSKYAALAADYERVLEQRDDALRAARAHLATTRTAAGQYTAADDTLTRVRLARLQDAVGYTRRIKTLARAVRRYRAALTAETRRADRLQAAYDHATGLDAPELDHGAQRQERREDKPRTVVAS